MTESLYILCLDEIYTPYLSRFDKFEYKTIKEQNNHWHFGLGGVVIGANQNADLNLQLHRLQNHFYPKHPSPIFHYVDLLQTRDLFNDLHFDNNKKQSLIARLNNWITDADFKFLATFVDMHKFMKTYGILNKETKKIQSIRKIKGNIYPKTDVKNYNLYYLCLKFLMKEFYEFLSNKKFPARGIIITEGRGKKEDTDLRNTFYHLQCEGISTISGKNLRQTIVDLLVIYKHHNHAGLQLADMLLYPCYDAYVPDHGVRQDHVIDIKKVCKGKHLQKKYVTIFP